MTDLINLEKIKAVPEAVAAVVGGYVGDPFGILGPHYYELEGKKYLVIRVFLPTAEKIVVTAANATYPMEKVHSDGFFEVIITAPPSDFSYKLCSTDFSGNTTEFSDVYSFGSLLTDFDLQLLGEGNHFHSYEKLGAHLKEINGVTGVQFAVWAPNARRVSVIGDFNQWDGRVLPMRLHIGLGIWEIFVPGLHIGTIYKYQIRSQFNDYTVEKADPYGFYSEMRPRTASVVADLSTYEWQDDAWVKEGRSSHNTPNAPISIYEVHLGSWRRRWNATTHDESYLNYRELAGQLVPYIKDMGYTHIQLLPVSEHPFDASWGYQTIGYYAVTSRYGTPQDFMYLVDQCHQNGIGVLIDWVPAHFPRDQHGLGFFDGTHLYEHADPRQGAHADWGTLVFNFGRNEVRNFLLSNALFWVDKYHIDGLRVDAVASILYLDYSRQNGAWIANQYGGRENLEAIDFLKRFNDLVHIEYPGVLTVAEDSTAWPMVTKPPYMGGLGFNFKWNMGWMHDMLDYMEQDPIYRKYHHNNLTFSMIYAFSENYVLPFSHDEVVHLKRSMLDKMPGEVWQKFANLRSLYGYMWTHPGKKLLFMGGEFGQWKEWNEREALQWELLDQPLHSGMQRFVKDLNHFYRSEAALYEIDDSWQGFEWLAFRDTDNSVISFLRRARDPENELAVICNFTPHSRYNYRIGVPRYGYYTEILNSDAGIYGGSNLGNLGGVWSDYSGWGEHPYSISVTLPPLSTIVLRSPGIEED
jgi:1,4-alpha-glucan branching enzyme